MPGRPNIPGGYFPADGQFRRLLSTIVLWDTSASTGRNDRNAKLGNSTSSRGASVALYGDKTGRVWMQDGQGGPSPTSILPFEPDNWTPRFHAKGKPTAKDSVWALRMIADHNNGNDQINCRSTMIIDQDAKQWWGWLADTLWVTGLGGKAGGPGLAYSGDGFLQMLGSYNTGQDSDQGGDEPSRSGPSGGGGRGRVAVSFAENQGLICDSAQVGQLAHVLCFLKPAKTRTSQSRPNEEAEVGLRADAKWKFGPGTYGRFVRAEIKIPQEDDEGEWKRVHLPVLDGAGNDDDKLWTAPDKSSADKKIKKDVIPQKIWGAVKIKKPGCCEPHHYDYSYHSPPPTSSSSSSSASDVATVDGGGGHSGEGSSTDEGTNDNGNGNRPDVPTIDDKYQNPDGTRFDWDQPSLHSNPASIQAQHGWATPASPNMAIRGNIFPKNDNANPLGTLVATKFKGYTGVIVQLAFCLSDELATGEAIEINALVGPHEGSSGPGTFYRQSFTILAEKGWEAVPKEYNLKFYFDGLKSEEQLCTVLIERRNDIDSEKGVNSPVELCVIRNTMLSNRQVLS